MNMLKCIVQTIPKWRQMIGQYCAGNTRLTLAVCCSLAGPLLRWAEGTDAAGVHVWGRSSLGKSTGHAVAASVWGIGGDSKTPGTYIQEWKASDNGLEGLAAQHSDAALILDEFGRLEPKIAGEAAYQLCNGKGKQRAATSGTARPRLGWRVSFYSAGESGLRDHMATAGMTPKAGQEIRFLEVPAEVAPNTMHETLHDFRDGDAFALAMKVATVREFGTVGREWLSWLVDNAGQMSATLRGPMEAFLRLHVEDESSGQVKRAGRCFALRAAAGELATAQGLTGWPAGWASEAIGKCWGAWLAARPGGIGMSEDAQMLRQLRGWFGLHGDSRFKPWHRTDSDNKPNIAFMAGWRKEIMGDERNSVGDLVSVPVSREWFVLPDVFRTEACKGFDEKACLRLLDSHGHLVREGKHFGCRASPPGSEKCTVYRVKSSLLGDVEE